MNRWLVPTFALLAAGACTATHESIDAATEDSQDAGLDAGMTPRSRIPQNHRPAPVMCNDTRPSVVPDGGFDASMGDCSDDADCVDGGLDGRCVSRPILPSPECSYDDCFSDSQCDGGVCACRDPVYGAGNQCLPGNCRVDADCGDGGYCSPSPGGCPPAIGPTGYYCHTAQDACVNDSDCAGFYCIYAIAVGDRWLCAPLDCSG